MSRQAWKRAANGLEYSYNASSATEICATAYLAVNSQPMSKTASDRSLDMLLV